MGLQIRFSPSFSFQHHYFEKAHMEKIFKHFLETIDDPRYGFFHIPKKISLVEQCKAVYQKHAHKTHLVQVGIGGSSLGPEMLVSSLSPLRPVPMTFLDNVDSEDLDDKLHCIDLKNALFFVVSKSGGTAETMANFSLLVSILQKEGHLKSDLSNLRDYFVFATDPEKGDLRELGLRHSIDLLEVPSNVGGRFSALTPVGLFPALFCGIDINSLLEGASEIGPRILGPNLEDNDLVKTAVALTHLYWEKDIDETVLMPYSSKCAKLSNWFVQLWAESLGKVRTDEQGNLVYEGMTPIASYGVTDQHSQVQLFMDGPRNKCILFVRFRNREKDFPLKNSFDVESLKKLSPYTLNQLMDAELEGTMKALDDVEREYIEISLEKRTAKSLGELILWLEALTVLVGNSLGIDPFNQPGVEAGKKYAFEFLQR